MPSWKEWPFCNISQNREREIWLERERGRQRDVGEMEREREMVGERGRERERDGWIDRDRDIQIEINRYIKDRRQNVISILAIIAYPASLSIL